MFALSTDIVSTKQNNIVMKPMANY
jgi:hypothetical protein